MPRVQAASTATKTHTSVPCDPPLEPPQPPAPPAAKPPQHAPAAPAPPPTTPAVSTVTATSTNKTYGFGEGVCTCARCMRRAGPIREDVAERIVQITYVLAGVYMDTPNPEEVVQPHHRQQAAQFMTCVEEGDVPGLRALFATVASPDDTVAEEIATELIISAAQLGQADVIRLLREQGADVEEKDLRRGGRPLMHAANNGHTGAVKALLEGDADTEARDDNGYTALMVAIFSDRSSAAQALLDAGAEVDATDDKGRTALSYAALYGSTDCIHLLSSAGANVFHADTEGALPLELAEDSGRTTAVDALRKLQLKHKMQQRRRQRRKPQQSQQELGEAELRAKEAEAAAVAQQLLAELEQEAAVKVAKAGKKKKKGKAKHQQDDAPEPLDTAPQTSHPAPTPSATTSPHPHSNGTSTAPAIAAAPASAPPTPPPPSNRRSHRQPAPPQPSPPSALPPPPTPDPTPARPPLDPISTAKLPPAAHPTTPPPTSPPIPTTADAVDPEALRRQWEEVLEEGARCRDPQRQPQLLEAVEALLPLCVAAGISVKYGRKVLQRLQEVAPARAALQAAMSRNPINRPELEAALKQARTARSLLAEGMVEAAEELLARTRAEQQERTWNELASSLSWDQRQASLPSSGAGSPLSGRGGSGGGGAAAAFDSVPSRLAGAGAEAEVEEENECVVCLSARKSMCCVPCGHVSMCRACSDEVQAAANVCPMCRTTIRCVIEIVDDDQ